MLTSLISHTYKIYMYFGDYCLLCFFYHFVGVEVVKVNGSVALECFNIRTNNFQWFLNSTDLNLLNITSTVINTLNFEFLFLNSIPLNLNNTVIKCFAILPDKRSVQALETTLYVQGLLIKIIEVYMIFITRARQRAG